MLSCRDVCAWAQGGRVPLAACRAAATQITNIPKLLQHLRTLARCLAFRQLLARALAREGVQALPQVVQEMSLASACLAGDLQGRLRVHICDTVGLPRPRGGIDPLLCSVSACPGLCRGVQNSVGKHTCTMLQNTIRPGP